MSAKFLNPFNKGVTYDEFLKAIPKGKSVEEYCKGKLNKNQIDWLVIEINNFKNK